MKTIIVHHRSPHHAENSGYGRLADYVDGESLPYLKSKFPYKLAKVCSGFFKKGAGTYDTMSVIKDYELCKRILFRNEKGIVHYLHGERDVRLGIQLNQISKNYKFIGTFHKPPELFDTYFPNVSYFKQLHGIIAVGENQIDFLKERLQIETVKHIPHGVNTNFFTPDENKRKENTLLFVGQHFRDFEGLNYAVPRLKEKIPKLIVNVVLRDDFAKQVTFDSCIRIYSGIDDMQLRRLYQEASLLFLPLIYSTACNSILEAMSCGLPVVSTNVGGNEGYVKNDYGVLLSDKRYDEMIDVLTDLLTDYDKRHQMALKARLAALQFDWSKVANQVQEFYNTVLSV